MRRVSSRQRLVSWDAFDATAGAGSGQANESSSFDSSNNDFDEESYASEYETAQSEPFHSSSTALDRLSEDNAIQGKKESDRKGVKLWTRRRKRDRKSRRSDFTQPKNICKNVEIPNASPVTSTSIGVPTIVPSYSWELAKPTTSKMLHFDGLIDDIHIAIFSFLDLSSLRSVMSINRHYRKLMVSEDARSGIWMDQCKKIWHTERKNRDGLPLKFVDDFHLPIAVTTAATNTFGSEIEGKKIDATNLSLLLSLAPTKFPTSIDQDALSPRRRLSRVIQQTIPSYRLEEEDQTIRCYQDSSTGRSIVQYTGYVGQGDRCIRSNHPLPRPTRPTYKSNSYAHSRNEMDSSGVALLGGNQHFYTELHRPFLLNFLRGNSKSIICDTSKFTRSSSSTSSTLQHSVEWAPFAVPFVDQLTNGSNTTVNVTPRFVSYFEVNILDCEKNNGGDNMIASNSLTAQRRSPSRRSSYTDCVAVGVATERFQFQSRMPGWDHQSYGYHGDDGGIFHSSGGMLKQFGPKFGAGDTVGCGIDYVSKGIFYTLNGEFLGYAWERISDAMLQKDLFPVVGIDTNSPIHMNFGSVESGGFEFDLSTFIKKHENLITSMYSLDGICCLVNTSASSTPKSGESSIKKSGSSLSSPRRQRRNLVGRRNHRDRKNEGN